MENKGIIALVIFLLAILALVIVYSVSDADDSGNRTDLTVSSEGPIPLDAIVEDVKTEDYYRGYDNETLAWMESLGDKKVFVADDAFVVMSGIDASRIPSVYVCDAYIDEFIECSVLENRSLGDIEYHMDVLLVKNVNYLGQETHYLVGS